MGLREEKLVSVSFVGGSGMLLTPSETLQAPCSQQELVSVGRMAGVTDWWVDRRDGQRDE